MPTNDRQEAVLNILRNLRDLDGLKKLFWEELNYERENRPLSPRQWPESARQPLAEDPILFATGGEDNAFHVVYCRLESDALLRGHERPVVNRLTREHSYALFIFSNKGRTEWHFLNVKYDEDAEKRRLYRRITVRPGEGHRTAAERMQMLDLEAISPDLFALSPLTIQQRHDDAFDVEKVSKDFYREIANWYFWALKHVGFPKDAPKEQDGRDHISVIRLITRLIFCWFIREKGLIPDVVFDEAKLAKMLDGFAPKGGTDIPVCAKGERQAGMPVPPSSVYYRAILQNLFFATLNTEMDQRGWRRADQNFMAHSLYRHKECFRDPKAGLEWFKDIPFLNGGLFECLDRDFGEGAKPRYLRVDGFSDRDDSRPTVPDFLFFGPEQDVDLSDDYGDKKFRSVRVRGLIDTLNRYKFTIEENTPLDQEVALDPELCGKVFENLLAAYNPETGTTARKATGSFYTPREIVDYMVDESLVAYLRGRVVDGVDKVDGGGEVDGVDARLRALLAYDGEPHGFDEKATGELIGAIDTLKALDPAVGSGAFPMGILHKLVHVLGKLDPDNERWKAKQIAKLDDPAMREDAERLFRENYDDYGRKLYLIENCIYGVDIQPIAVQIAKMRFFISLIVDQKVNSKAPNFGVRALPNLETKFVAANTLIGIDRPAQMMLRNPDIDKKEAELRRVREKHFTAKTLKSKAKCRDDDKRLRAEIAGLLKNDGWDNTTAKQLAAWDPYDQNAHAEFFDPEWMFGVTEGFDVVIGNPPYLFGEHLADQKKLYKRSFEVASGQFDAYWLFYERSLSGLLRERGTHCFINSDAMLARDESAGFRKWLLQNAAFLLMSHVGQVFGGVGVSAVVVLVLKGTEPLLTYTVVPYFEGACMFGEASSLPMSGVTQDPKARLRCSEAGGASWEFLSRQPACIGDFFVISRGEELGKKHLSRLEANSAPRGCVPVLAGEGVTRFSPPRPTHFVSKSMIVKPTTNYDPPKIVIVKTGASFVAAVDDQSLITLQSVYNLRPKGTVPCELGCALLNSRLLNAYLKWKITGQKKLFPQITQGNVLEMPVPDVPIEKHRAIVGLVERILAAKAADPAADTSAWEREIDERVYKLYGLTAEEIAIVEGANQ